MLTAIEIYLDYVDNWLTIKSMADSSYYGSYGLEDENVLKELINEGRIAFNWKFHIGTMK
jgi:hypothetical protein